MKTLREVLRAFNNAFLAGGTHKGGVFRCETGVASVEFGAAIYHLLLAERGELVCSEGVGEGL